MPPEPPVSAPHRHAPGGDDTFFTAGPGLQASTCGQCRQTVYRPVVPGIPTWSDDHPVPWATAGELPQPAPRSPDGPVTDLLAALQASVERARTARKAITHTATEGSTL